MKVSMYELENGGVPEGAKWLYWENASRAYFGPISNEEWHRALEEADRLLAIGTTRTIDMRRLDGRGWRGRAGTNPDSGALKMAYAGGGTLMEPRLDAAQWTHGKPPPLKMDLGMAPDSHQTVWLPFIEGLPDEEES